jgi:hypothetical protein
MITSDAIHPLYTYKSWYDASEPFAPGDKEQIVHGLEQGIKQNHGGHAFSCSVL